MVDKQKYQLVVNNKNVTNNILPYLISLEVTDNEKNESDELRITISKKFTRPAYREKIKVFLGNQLQFVGLFYVQKTTIRNNKELIITATSVDFSSTMKKRRHTRYKQTSLANIASTIANRYNIRFKSDVTHPIIDVDQVDESDINLLNRLAKEHGKIFNIKNDTLYFMHRTIAPPIVTLDINECTESEITHLNKTLYKSCATMYQNTQTNQCVIVSVGNSEPMLVKQGHFHNDDEARVFAQNALSRANQNTVAGSATFSGRVVFAGSRLNLDGQHYVISRVTHKASNAGWLTSIEFNNKDSLID